MAHCRDPVDGIVARGARDETYRRMTLADRQMVGLAKQQEQTTRHEAWSAQDKAGARHGQPRGQPYLSSNLRDNPAKPADPMEQANGANKHGTEGF